MSTVILAMVGAALLAVTFFVGVVVGSLRPKADRIGSWLKRHGCYKCREEYRYSLQGQLDEATDFDDEDEDDDN